MSVAEQLTNDDKLYIKTLGGFQVSRGGVVIASTAWGREKAVHLFQYLVTMRRYTARQHKEQIMDQIWFDIGIEKADREFRVALNAVNKALEPERKPRADPRYIQRHDLTYTLNLDEAAVDADQMEAAIAQGNQLVVDAPQAAIPHYQRALALYQGDYLPERRYEDWSSAERERLQVLALGTMTTLARLLLQANPLESIRLTQRVLAIDPMWEDAYRLQMHAYMAQGNRPLAVRTYEQCRHLLAEELGIDPLPETQELYHQIVTKV